MDWCENHGIGYVFGFAGNDVLHAVTGEAAKALAAQREHSGKDKLRSFKAFRYGAKSWTKQRRFVARIEATTKGVDVRYVVSSLRAGARHLYETLYCARGNAENFIKLHKSQLASDRTSCRDPKANQFRLILHTAAYWLMLAMRDAAPKRSPLATAEFATLRLRLLKIAARVVEGAARIRVFLPTACPERVVSARSPDGSAPQDLEPCGAVAAPSPSSKPPTHETQIVTRRATCFDANAPPCPVGKNHDRGRETRYLR
jgi:hypothetical protein